MPLASFRAPLGMQVRISDFAAILFNLTPLFQDALVVFKDPCIELNPICTGVYVQGLFSKIFVGLLLGRRAGLAASGDPRVTFSSQPDDVARPLG